jgi:hypothetical protein
MKIISNVRAGSQTQNQKQGSSLDNTVVYYAPISRCVGL